MRIIYCVGFILGVVCVQNVRGAGDPKAEKERLYRPCKVKDLVGKWDVLETQLFRDLPDTDALTFPSQAYVFHGDGTKHHLTVKSFSPAVPRGITEEDFEMLEKGEHNNAFGFKNGWLEMQGSGTAKCEVVKAEGADPFNRVKQSLRPNDIILSYVYSKDGIALLPEAAQLLRSHVPLRQPTQANASGQ